MEPFRNHLRGRRNQPIHSILYSVAHPLERGSNNYYSIIQGEARINIRKPVDYSAMFAALDTLMAENLPQIELYCEIGRLVSGRPEKGAAVAAAEYLCAAYPDISGFSPRNLRRMWEFYRTYETAPAILAESMTIGWTQNVVILETELTPQERAWYIKAAGQFSWSKLELQQKIADNTHLGNRSRLHRQNVLYCGKNQRYGVCRQ